MEMQSLFLVVNFFLAITQLVKGQPPQPRSDCQTRCGNTTIEYPFGISSGCYYPGTKSFNITCTEGRPFLKNIEVKNFDHSGKLRVMLTRSRVCFDEQGKKTDNSTVRSIKLGKFSFSDNNKFIVVGCNGYALLSILGKRKYSTGCMSFCNSLPAANRECNGEGCCRTDVSAPLGSYEFQIAPARYNNLPSVYHFNPCIYAFIVVNGTFNFSSTQDLGNLRNVKEFPVMLDWSIGNKTCSQVGNTNICGRNSTCFDSTRRTGYICKCLQGFEGNPYLAAGCQDINECTTSSTIHRHNCSDPNTCRNTVGDFYCKCPSGYELNAITNNSCNRKQRPVYFGWTVIFLGTTIGFLVIALVISCIQQQMKHRKNIKLRQYFFEQNGGGMLRQRLSGAGSSNVDVKIFTEESMKVATNGYDTSRILGEGGQGTVYKGILPDKSIVAIKKARLGDNSQVEQFINEVLVLSQINHRNVVKLLGCCLETEVPLLVYEFITSGTLFDHLHGSMFDSSLTWEHRRRIAIEVAGTLAYLHSAASIPIIHRDVKTANILLDENLTAKVADFGASRLIPMDKEQLTTMVQGTIGYLDPEYYTTGLLNEKSDVYSFGVVLMELLSGQKAMCFERPQNSKHLVSYFAYAMKENRLHEIIDVQVMNEDNQKEIHEVVRVAIECTRIMGEARPKMKEVAAELEGLRVTKSKHQYPEPLETENLLGFQNLAAQGDTGSSGYDSLNTVPKLDIVDGR